MRRAIAIGVLAVGWLVHGSARAEGPCPPGQVVIAATGACAPAPQCPTGYTFDGSVCAPSSAPLAPDPVPTQPSGGVQVVDSPAFVATTPASWPVANGPPTAAFNPQPGREIRRGYLWSSLVFLLGNYGLKIPVVLGAPNGDDASCIGTTNGLLLVPALGGILGLIASTSCGYSRYPGESTSLFSNYPAGYLIPFGVDLLGIALLTIALIGRPAASWESRSASRVRVVPAVAGGTGLTLSVDL